MKNETEMKRLSIQLSMCPGVCSTVNPDEACSVCQFKYQQNCAGLLQKELLSLLQKTQEPAAQAKQEQLELKSRVTQIIHDLGVPAHIMGYKYVRHAIMLVVHEPRVLNAVTTRLYPEVAAHFDTTSSRVERAIRHAIEVAWERGNVDTLQKWFGWTINNMKGKPTNTEFIGLVADAIMLEREKEAK